MELMELLYKPDMWWIIGLLVATIVLGYYSGRDTRSVRDFAVGKKGFVTPILVFTLIATNCGGGSLLGHTGEIFKAGVIFLVVELGIAMGSLLFARFVAPRFDSRFRKLLSVGDVMERIYGDVMITRLTAILGTLFAIGMIAGQFLAIGIAMEVFLGVNGPISVVVFGLIVTAYSIFGGVKAVTITDVMQLAVIVVVLPIIASLGLWKYGGTWGIISNIGKIDPAYTTIFHHDLYSVYAMMFLINLGQVIVFYPPVVQRILMARSPRQIAQVFYAYGAFRIIFAGLILLIAFTGINIQVETGETLNSNSVILKVVETFLPYGYKGMAAIAILAAIMSTADSHLNAASVLFTHNVLMPDKEGKYKKDEERMEEKELEAFRMKDTEKLFRMRFVTAAIGSLGILLALMSENILRLFYSSEALFAALVGFPLFMGLFYFKVSRLQYWACAISAITGYIFVTWYSAAYNVKNLVEYGPPLTAIFAGALGFITMHILQNRGIAFVSQETQLRKDKRGNTIETSIPIATRISIWKKIKSLSKFIPTPSRITKYCTNKYRKVNPQVMLFCTFCIGSYAVPFFMFPWGKDSGDNFITAIVIRIIASILCFALAFHQYWPQRYEKIMPVLWHFTLFFCLPYGTTILYFVERGSQEWVLNMSLAIVLLISMTDWRTFVLLSILGVSAGYTTFKILLDDPSIGDFSFDASMASFYTLLFTLLIGFFFVRRKEEDMEEKEENFGISIGMIAHEIKNYLSGIKMPAELIRFIISSNKRQVPVEGGIVYSIEMNQEDNETVERMIGEIPDVAQKSLAKLSQMIDAVRNSNDIEARQVHSVKEALRDLLDQLPDLRPEQRQRITIRVRNDIYYRGLQTDFCLVIENLIRNAFGYGGSDVNIQVFVRDQQIIIEDDGIGIPEDQVEKIFDKFYTGESPLGTGLGLALCKTKIELMGGKIYCQSEVDRYTRFIIEMPKIKGPEEIS
jgi:Na+/proline symporter/signal transduction histidine kinase